MEQERKTFGFIVLMLLLLVCSCGNGSKKGVYVNNGVSVMTVKELNEQYDQIVPAATEGDAVPEEPDEDVEDPEQEDRNNARTASGFFSVFGEAVWACGRQNRITSFYVFKPEEKTVIIYYVSDGSHKSFTGRECEQVEELNITSYEQYDETHISVTLAEGRACYFEYVTSAIATFRFYPEDGLIKQIQNYYKSISPENSVYARMTGGDAKSITVGIYKLKDESSIILTEYIIDRQTGIAKNASGEGRQIQLSMQ